MDTRNKQVALNSLLAAFYGFAVVAATLVGNETWGVLVAAALPILRAILGFFGELPMDDPAPGPD